MSVSRREESLFVQCALRGFDFGYTGRGGPLVGIRRSEGWVDTIHIEGLDGHCLAWRQRAEGEGPLVYRSEGSAETVMVEVLNWGCIRVYTAGGALYALG